MVLSLALLGLLGEEIRHEFVEVHMGVDVRLAFYRGDGVNAEAVAEEVYARFADLEQKMSDYRPTSEIRQAQESRVGEWVRVSGDLYRVLSLGQEVARLSEGAFDMTAGPVVGVWREARKTGEWPGWRKTSAAVGLVGWKNLELKDGKMRVLKEGVQVDLGGIAKGFACDEAIRIFDRNGVGRASVVAGGDLKVSGPPPGREGWDVTVAGGKKLVVRDVAVSTSGDAEQFVEFYGGRYSHIVDPRTGYGVRNRVQATVIARDGVFTDPWATALCVVGRGGRKLVRELGGEVFFEVSGD